MADWNFLNYEGLEYYDNKSEVRTDEKIAVETERAKNAENNIQTQLNTKAPLASPTLTGTPKAPTATAGTNSTQIATTAFVRTAVANGIAASDAMIIKGTIGTSGTVTSLPTTYKTGWTYRVVTAGTYAGQVCEIGDLIVALVDRSGSGNVDSDWCVAQTNINGAITGIKSGDAYIVTSQSGSVVTITHKDVTRTNTTSTASPSHGGTFTAVKTVTSDAKGHVTGVDTETVTLPSAYTHPTYTARTGVPTANQTPAFGGTFSVSQPVSDATGHITAMNSRTITIPSAVATTSSAGLESAADKTKLDATNIAYGTCSTDADTAAKVVTISGNTNWALTVGSIIVVKFTVTNTASSVTLNVNNTGAKSIWYNNGVYTGGSSAICGYVNRYTTYMYDGTNWVWISNGIDNNSTYSPATLGQGYGTCATAEATVAKVVTLSSYSLVTGGIVAVKFTYAVPASATMNINSKGAKSIYYRGAAITAGIIKAGDIGVFMYNGTQYHLLTVDRDNNTTYTLNYDKDNSELQLKTGDSVVSAVTITGGSPLKIVTWADGTYEEISAMLDAHYAGTIDISNYWSVGDVRTIPLSAMSATGVGESQSAQNAEVVIIGFGHDDLVSPVNGNSKSAVSLQLKNSLETVGYMYSAYKGTSYSLWDGSPRRTWCNSVFKNALPSELANLIKTVTKKTWRYAHSSYSSYRTQQTTNDDCFLISEFEVFGVQELSTTDYGAVGEDGTQYEYYKTSSNRIKYLGVNGTSAKYWWLRSSHVNGSGYSGFRDVSTSGSVGSSLANYTNGVAPGFCI